MIDLHFAFTKVLWDLEFESSAQFLSPYVLFIGLVAKNQWLNTKYQPKFYIDILFWKEKRPGFSKRNDNNNFGWYIWYLVISF